MTRAKHIPLAGILAIALLSATPALGQHDERDDDAPIISFDLTPRLLDNLLDKATQRLAKNYQFDDYQREQMRQVLQERVPKFLKEHREELQRLAHEWTESVSGENPPSAEDAADWADRALPMVEEFKGLLGGVSEDMREFLTEDQEFLLDGYMAGAEVAVESVSNRLHVFKDGGFDSEIHWPGNRKARKASRQQARELRREVESVRRDVWDHQDTARNQLRETATARETAAAREAPAPQPDNAAKASPAPKTAKDEWAVYVERFIKRYQLDDQQTQKAHLFLDQQKQRRDQHLQRSAASMERVKKMFDGAKTPRERELAESAYQRFNQPIERMFDKLKQKLNTLPTRAQRKAAAVFDGKLKQKGEQDPQ